MELQKEEIFDGTLSQEMLNNINITEQDTKSWPSMVQDLYTLVEYECNKRNGQVKPIDIFLSLTHFLGGKHVYIPKADRVRKQIRNMQIYAEFDGKNIQYLVRKYKLVEQQIYRIISQQRALEIKKRQEEMGAF